MADYFVELDQIGSSGRVIFTTNFGFGFVAELIQQEIAQSMSGRKRAGSRRNRVITLVSSCCAYSFKRINTESGAEYICSGCGKSSIYPADLVDREYLNFDSASISDFTNCITLTGIEQLEAIFVGDKLIDLVTELWDGIANGQRVRQLLKAYESPIAL